MVVYHRIFPFHPLSFHSLTNTLHHLLDFLFLLESAWKNFVLCSTTTSQPNVLQLHIQREPNNQPTTCKLSVSHLPIIPCHTPEENKDRKSQRFTLQSQPTSTCNKSDRPYLRLLNMDFVFSTGIWDVGWTWHTRKRMMPFQATLKSKKILTKKLRRRRLNFFSPFFQIFLVFCDLAAM